MVMPWRKGPGQLSPIWNSFNFTRRLSLINPVTAAFSLVKRFEAKEEDFLTIRARPLCRSIIAIDGWRLGHAMRPR